MMVSYSVLEDREACRSVWEICLSIRSSWDVSGHWVLQAASLSPQSIMLQGISSLG